MKEGLCEPGLGEKEELLGVCRFYSTKSGTNLISLDNYLDNMIEGQEEIFFITGDDLENLRQNPQLEGFIKRNIEVLLLKDGVDSFWVNVINNYKNKNLTSVNRADIDLDKLHNLSEVEDNQAPDHTNNPADYDQIKNKLIELCTEMA